MESWETWRKFVLSKLDELQSEHIRQSGNMDKKTDEIAKALEKIRIDINTLKIKSSLWGAMAGGISAIGAIIISHIKS